MFALPVFSLLLAASTLQLPSSQVVADWSITDSSIAHVTHYIISHDDSNLIVGVEINAGLLEHRNVFTVPFADLLCLSMGRSDDGVFIDFKSAPNAVVHERATTTVTNGQAQDDQWQADTTLSESLIAVDIDSAHLSAVTNAMDALFERYKLKLPINKGDCSPESL